jgi:antitoxin Phd
VFDNKPVYIVIKYDGEDMLAENITDKHANYTLQEAMKYVLSEVDNTIMHASELADEIYRRKWSRCGHYPDMLSITR